MQNPIFDKFSIEAHFNRFYNPDNLLLKEVIAAMHEKVAILTRTTKDLAWHYRTCIDDVKQIWPNQKTDVIASLFALHIDINPIETIAKYLSHLNSDGIMLASVYGGETLKELRQAMLDTDLELFSGASPRIYPMIDIQDLGMLAMRAGAKYPVLDSEIFTYKFNDIIELINFIRSLGYSNCLSMRNHRIMPKNYFKQVEKNYRLITNDLIVTFEVITLSIINNLPS